MTRPRPEVLAPAGAPDCLPAAVAGGADAVYLGLRHFNARGRAENFRTGDLGRQVDYLHDHGVKAYVVLNTLVHDDEHPKALALARAAHEARVDAVIVQDLGLWEALARELPGLERHASTQMTVHHPSQIAVLARLGARRIILARELELSEVRACADAARAHGVEVEHFVHGALCYAFSGQCQMSNFAGCRSANRGTCAQNCRFDYRREQGFADPSAAVDTELSMKDLELIERVGALADAGVVSLKIEGRLKGPEYVYTVARAYRAATEAWARGSRFDATAERGRLREVFARANDGSPLAGEYGEAARLHRYQPEQDRSPDAHLESLDRASGEAVVRASTPIAAGQGFAFTVGTYNGGFLVIAARALGAGRWQLRVRIDERGPRLRAQLPLFRNVDHARRREAEQAMTRVPVPKALEGVGLALTVSGRRGEPLTLVACSEDGRRAEERSSQALELATGAALDEAALRATVGALGGSGFHLASLGIVLEPGCFLPLSQLKQLRRALVSRLAALPVPEQEERAPAEPVGAALPRSTAVWAAVASVEAARAALAAGAAAAWLDDARLDLWGAQPPSIDAAGFRPGQLWLRHPTAAPLSPHLAASGRAVVCGPLGVIAAAAEAGLRAVADSGCNLFSAATARVLNRLGAAGVVVSLECSAGEIARLCARMAQSPGIAIAMIAAGRLPAMLTRQDHGLALGEVGVIRAEEHDGGLPYQLQRRVHDTVVWEGRRLCAPEEVVRTNGLVDAWVLELADLAPEAVAAVVGAYRDLRDGRSDAVATRAAHEAHAAFGTFSGHLHQGSRALDAVMAGNHATA